MIRVTRIYRFSAAHVLARPDWEPDQNQKVYGQCANPAGHGHNYILEVRLRGSIDRETGHLLSPERLDQMVKEKVLDRLDHGCLNQEVDEFASRVPTAENIARFVWRSLVGAVAPAWLDRVRLEETRKNSVEYSEDVA